MFNSFNQIKACSLLRQSRITSYNVCYTKLLRVNSRALGNEIANLSKGDNTEMYALIKNRVLLMLRQPSSLNKIKQSLWKNYSFLKKHKELRVEDVLEPTELRNMHHIAEELLKIERSAYEYGTFFGSAPIAYKPSR